MPDEAILTAAKAALLLNVTDRTIRNWADENKIPFITLPSGQKRFRRADIDAILATAEPA